MNISWQPVRVGDLGRVVTGKTPPSARPECFGTDFPFVTPSDIGTDTRHVTVERFISSEGHHSMPRYLLPPKAVCVVCIGATIGKICMTDAPSFTNQQINSVVVDETRFDPFFVYYALRQVGPSLLGLASGAATPIINKSSFSDVRVSIPSLPAQRRIASILSAYDDLIENNTRRIAILEEMARRIYEEWFVRFRFPGHERVEMVESESGLIPEGWCVTTLQNYCSTVTRGVTPKYQSGSGRFVINQKANRGSELLRSELKELEAGLCVPAGKYARFSDVLVNSLGEGTIGRVHHFIGPDNEWAVDQHMTICRCREAGAGFLLYQYLSSDAGQAKISSVKTGATSMTMLNISSLRNFEIVSPEKQVLDDYWQFCSPIVSLKANLQQKNTNLRATRDLLLPKLISGELDVSTLPEPEAVAA